MSDPIYTFETDGEIDFDAMFSESGDSADTEGSDNNLGTENQQDPNNQQPNSGKSTSIDDIEIELPIGFDNSTSGVEVGSQGAGSEQGLTPAMESVAKFYESKGTLTPEDVEYVKQAKTIDELYERIEEKRTDKFDPEFVLTSEEQSFIKAYRSGIKPDEYVDLNTQLDNLKKMTDETIATATQQGDHARRELVRQMYIEVKNYSAEDADIIAKNLSGKDLVTKAKEARDSLIPHMESKITELNTADIKKQEQLAEERKQYSQKIADHINNSKDILGITLTDTLKTKMIDYATAKTDNGKHENYLQKLLRENPEETTAKISLLLAMTNGLKDVKPLLGDLTTKATRDLQQIIDKGNASPGSVMEQNDGRKKSVFADSGLESLFDR